MGGTITDLAAAGSFGGTGHVGDESHVIGLETLVNRRTRALTRTQEAVIFGLAKLADSRIQAYVRLLCDQIAGHDADDVRARITVVTRAAALHDVGKVGVPDNVLWKPGPLSDDERTVMQQHTVVGGNTLRAGRAARLSARLHRRTG